MRFGCVAASSTVEAFEPLILKYVALAESVASRTAITSSPFASNVAVLGSGSESDTPCPRGS